MVKSYNKSTNINACEVWKAMAGVQVFKRDLHTHIHVT